MFKLTVLAFVVTAVRVYGQQDQLSFIHKCSKNDPNIDKCFVENGNRAMEEINTGVSDLELPDLNGFDFGDLFVGLGQDLSYLLEDIKGYQKGITLDTAHLHFDSTKTFRRVDLSFTFVDVAWFLKYRALGFVGDHKVNEKGNAQIHFGNVTINSTLDFKHKVVDGVTYLKARSHDGIGKYQKYEFVPSNVKGSGKPLGPEEFLQLEEPVVNKALEITLAYITFAFNQIFQAIPESELFLP